MLLFLFRTLLDGKVVEYLWGCRKCYSAFESEQSFEIHIAKDHQGKVVNFNGGVGGGKNILVTSVKIVDVYWTNLLTVNAFLSPL